MSRYLLDTNAVSELRRPRPDPGLIAGLSRYRTLCALPAPVIEELQFGISQIPDEAKRDMFQRWLAGLIVEFPVIDFDLACAQWLGHERARLKRAGQTPPLHDAMIAATAVANDLTLVTRNVADFQRFNGLRLQNWFKE